MPDLNMLLKAGITPTIIVISGLLCAAILVIVLIYRLISSFISSNKKQG